MADQNSKRNMLASALDGGPVVFDRAVKQYPMQHNLPPQNIPNFQDMVGKDVNGASKAGPRDELRRRLPNDRNTYDPADGLQRFQEDI